MNVTMVIGLVILIGGGLLYGRFCERVFEPDDRKTPAYKNEDGVNYLSLKPKINKNLMEI